ncbi:MAG: hypothetical protein ACI835_003225 [Planctomycetota bacterium]|jgi:hypothetical protein
MKSPALFGGERRRSSPSTIERTGTGLRSCALRVAPQIVFTAEITSSGNGLTVVVAGSQIPFGLRLQGTNLYMQAIVPTPTDSWGRDISALVKLGLA